MNVALFIVGMSLLSALAGSIVLNERKKHNGSMELAQLLIIGKDHNPLRLLIWLLVFTAAIPFIFVYGGIQRCIRQDRT